MGAHRPRSGSGPRMVAAKASHLQGVTHEATGGFGQAWISIRVVMGNQHGLARLEQHLDLGDQGRLLLGSQGAVVWPGRGSPSRLPAGYCSVHCSLRLFHQRSGKAKNYNQKPPQTHPKIGYSTTVRTRSDHILLFCQRSCRMKQRSLKFKLLRFHAGTFLASGVADDMDTVLLAERPFANMVMRRPVAPWSRRFPQYLQFQAERYAVQITQMQQAYQIPLGTAAD